MLEGLKKEEKCYTIIFWVILLFFHLPHNSKGNFSPLFIFTLLKRKKGIFLRFKTLLQFYRGKFHCKSSKSLVAYTNQEKEGFLLICPPCTYLFSHHQTCLRILQGHEGIYFLIILSQQTQECLYGVQRKRSRTNTTGEGEIKNLLITANPISL